MPKKKFIPAKNVLTSEEAALIMGRHRTTVTRYIDDGLLPGKKVRRSKTSKYIIPKDDFIKALIELGFKFK